MNVWYLNQETYAVSWNNILLFLKRNKRDSILKSLIEIEFLEINKFLNRKLTIFFDNLWIQKRLKIENDKK